MYAYYIKQYITITLNSISTFLYPKYTQPEFCITPFWFLGPIFWGIETYLINTKVKKPRHKLLDSSSSLSNWNREELKLTLSIFHISCWKEQAKPLWLEYCRCDFRPIFPAEWKQVQVSNPWGSSWSVPL